jgi:hypothetical protein
MRAPATDLPIPSLRIIFLGTVQVWKPDASPPMAKACRSGFALMRHSNREILL